MTTPSTPATSNNRGIMRAIAVVALLIIVGFVYMIRQAPDPNVVTQAITQQNAESKQELEKMKFEFQKMLLESKKQNGEQLTALSTAMTEEMAKNRRIMPEELYNKGKTKQGHKGSFSYHVAGGYGLPPNSKNMKFSISGLIGSGLSQGAKVRGGRSVQVLSSPPSPGATPPPVTSLAIKQVLDQVAATYDQYKIVPESVLNKAMQGNRPAIKQILDKVAEKMAQCQIVDETVLEQAIKDLEERSRSTN